MTRTTTVTSLPLLVLGALAGLALADEPPSLESKHDIKIDPAKPHPGIVYSDILQSLQDQVAWEKGEIRMFERVRMTFLPPFKDPRDSSAYNPFTGGRIATQIVDSKKAVVSTVFWNCAEAKFPLWTCNAVGNSQPPALAPGTYTYRWLLEAKPFWQLSFSVEQAKAKSAYQKPRYHFDGPWDQHAYIYVPNGNVSTSPTFNLFLRDKASKPGSWVSKAITVEVRRGGKLVAEHPGPGKSEHRLRPWWQKLDLSLRAPGSKTVFEARELLKKGTYTVVVKLDGKKHATYRYKAKGGDALPLLERQQRGVADSMTYLEGNEDRFFIERIK